MMFWLVLILLGLVAAAFVVAPLLLSSDDSESDSRQDLNLALYREHVADLSENTLNPEQIELEAKRNLLEDSGSGGELLSRHEGAGSTKMLLLAGILIPVIGFVIYADFGLGRGAISDLRLKEELDNFQSDDPQAHRQLTEKLAARAAHRPDDAELSFFLAKSYSAQGDYEKASTVFGRLLDQYPNDAGLHSYYAESLFVADNRRMTERVRAALDTALSMNPHDITLLEIEGISAITDGRFQDALNWFQKALATGVSGRRAELIRSAVTRIHSQLGLEGEVQESTGRALSVSVSTTVSEALPASATVFVYARAETGPPAPLAVQRMRLADLPATVRLDESMAMVAGMGLANFDRVIVIARISLSGDVVPKSGDYEIRSEVIDMTSPPETLPLVIEHQIP